MATIYDVAERAGVSHTSVSAVLTGKQNQVGEKTRNRILEAIQDLRYNPSSVARQLATGKSNTMAICFNRPLRHALLNINGPIIAGIADSALDRGYSIIITSADPNDTVQQAVESVVSHGVGGAVVIGPIHATRAVAEIIEGVNVPVVCVDSFPGFAKVSTVDIDNGAAMRTGVEHLIAQGHRHIMFVGPPPGHQCHIERMRAFYEVMNDHGLPVGKNTIRVLGLESAQNVVSDILKSSDRPTAIVCGEGVFSTAAWHAISALGMHIPDDVSLLTFDFPPADHPNPEVVSVVRPSPYNMGVAAADLLQKIIAGEMEPPVNIRLPADIVLCPSPVPHPS